MKIKTTRAAIVRSSNNIISAGYCDLTFLLNNHSPMAYTRGIYGWNFDVYEIDGVTICTGYRNMPGRKANNIHDYEERARKILSWKNESMTFDEKRAAVENLLHEFLRQA